MSDGLSLLSAVITAQGRNFVRNLVPELFLDAERQAFGFFTYFYRTYGGLPSHDIMRQNGHELPVASAPPLYYLERVVNRAIHNEVRNTLPDFQAALQRVDVPSLVTAVNRMKAGTGRYASVNDAFLLPDAAEMAMQQYAETRDSGGGELAGITLGWDGLDAATGGAMPGEVITWVARPNIGKSWAISKSSLAANDQDRKVLLVSMEMGAVPMARRLIGLKAGINPDYIKRGTLSMWGEEMIFESIQTTRNRPDFVLVSGNLTKSVDVVDALIQEYTPDVVYIDAQYLMQPSDKKGGLKKFELLDKVGVEIQQMSIARSIPIHQSVQFNREQATNSPGDLRNIGGTDTVGQISSLVIAISEGAPPDERTRRVYEILKNREGPLSRITANFLFNPLDFSEIEEVPQEDEQRLNTDWML